MSTRPLICLVFGTQGPRYRRGSCGPCALAADLRVVLDDGTGSIRPELLPLAEGLAVMRNPRAGVNWISRPHVHQMLQTLARPDTPLTHETLNDMSPWRSVAYLRDLLMHHGVLPPADRQLMLFQRWLSEMLAGIGHREHRRIIERFAAWHVQRRLRRFADHGPVTGKQTQQARAETHQATAFLTWLHNRSRDLATCGQTDIDAWYAQAYTARRLTHAFLRWSMRNKLLAHVRIPHQDTRRPAPISQPQRLATIRRLLTTDDLPLLTRVAATLMLLYAQPLTRITRLRIDDVLHDDGEVSIRLGDPPTPVPEPLARLLLEHLDNRLNLTTATNHDAQWLFPGRRGGQPMTPDALQTRFRHAGIPALNGRTAALRHLVLQTPAPVVARMLGYTHDHTARITTEIGGTWTRYAAGNHTQ
ncbi:MAG: hypothetical protein ACRDRI_13470 [Pseudonocardiaceae bacterium]